MEKRNLLFQLGFVIVVLLALGLAFMRVSNTGIGTAVSVEQAEAVRPRSGRFLPPEVARRTVESLKNEELLGVSPSGAGGFELSKDQKRAQAVRRYGRISEGEKKYGARQSGDYAYVPSSGMGKNYGTSGRLPASGRYAGREGIGNLEPSAHMSRERGNFAAGKTDPYQTGGRPAGTIRTAGTAGVYRPNTKERMQGVFSPYLTSLTPEAAKSLERQLTGLSSRVERAVLQALLPKSRKDANIEKYLQRNSSYSASSSPFASVENQMAAQKAGIMNSMNGAFGKDAADEAGKVMDAYQKELSAALSQKGLTQEQAAQKAREIGAKYEKELQAVGEKHALKEFKEQRETKDNVLQNQLAQAYGADIAAQADAVLASWREKDMQLALSGLPADEYYKQQLENQRARRKELEQVLLKNGKSLQGLQAAEDELERRRVEQALKDEAEGKTLPTEHHFDEKTITAATNDLRRERDEKLELAERIYGETGGAAVSAIYDRHEARMSEIMHSDLPFTVKQQKIMETRQQTNSEIAALQKSPEMREAREQGQVNSTMAQLMQDPGVANASPEEKAAFEAYARPVLQDMFHRINAISESDLPEDVKQRQIAAVQDRAQRQLSGGQ